MKLKDINIVERHIEKPLIAVTLIIFCATAYYWVLHTPNVVKLNGQERTAKTIDNAVLKEAKRLERELAKNKVNPILAKLNVPKYTEDFHKRIQADLLANTRFSMPFGEIPVFGNDATYNPLNQPVVELTIPTTPIVAARTKLWSIHPDEIQNNQQLATRFAANGPFDTPCVSVTASFDSLAMFNALDKKGDDDIRKIPQEWWKNLFGITDIQLQRQEKLPDGSWSKPTTVSPIHTEIHTFCRRLSEQKTINPAHAREYINWIIKNQAQIIQPAFPMTLGEQWSPPEKIDEEQLKRLAQYADKAKQVEEKIRLKNKQLQSMIKKLERLKSRTKRPASSKSTRTTTASRKTKRSATATSAKDRLVARQTELINKTREEIKKLQEEYQRLTGKKAASPPTPPPPPTYNPEEAEIADEMLEEERVDGPSIPSNRYTPRPTRVSGTPARSAGTSKVRSPQSTMAGLAGGILDGKTKNIWSYDLSIEQGKTYRYRIRIAITNPMFNKKLPDNQAELAKPFVRFSDWGDWSKPITIDRLQHYFVVNAATSPAPGQATIEVWRFFQGTWVNNSFRVQAGNPIGTVKEMQLADQHVPIDFFTGAYVVDFDFNFTDVNPKNRFVRKIPRVYILRNNRIEIRRSDETRDNLEYERLKEKAAAEQVASGR